MGFWGDGHGDVNFGGRAGSGGGCGGHGCWCVVSLGGVAVGLKS